MESYSPAPDMPARYSILAEDLAMSFPASRKVLPAPCMHATVRFKTTATIRSAQRGPNKDAHYGSTQWWMCQPSGHHLVHQRVHCLHHKFCWMVRY